MPDVGSMSLVTGNTFMPKRALGGAYSRVKWANYRVRLVYFAYFDDAPIRSRISLDRSDHFSALTRFQTIIFYAKGADRFGFKSLDSSKHIQYFSEALEAAD